MRFKFDSDNDILEIYSEDTLLHTLQYGDIDRASLLVDSVRVGELSEEERHFCNTATRLEGMLKDAGKSLNYAREIVLELIIQDSTPVSIVCYSGYGLNLSNTEECGFVMDLCDLHSCIGRVIAEEFYMDRDIKLSPPEVVVREIKTREIETGYVAPPQQRATKYAVESHMSSYVKYILADALILWIGTVPLATVFLVMKSHWTFVVGVLTLPVVLGLHFMVVGRRMYYEDTYKEAYKLYGDRVIQSTLEYKCRNKSDSLSSYAKFKYCYLYSHRLIKYVSLLIVAFVVNTYLISYAFILLYPNIDTPVISVLRNLLFK